MHNAHIIQMSASKYCTAIIIIIQCSFSGLPSLSPVHCFLGGGGCGGQFPNASARTIGRGSSFVRVVPLCTFVFFVFFLKVKLLLLLLLTAAHCLTASLTYWLLCGSCVEGALARRKHR